MSEKTNKRMSRRQFITVAGAAGAVVSLAGSLRPFSAFGQTKTLTIKQWSHFVPAYDVWFDAFAQDWGAKNGVQVTVDHISFAQLVPDATAEVAAQSGHDLFGFISPPSAFELNVIDHKDVVAAVEAKHGPIADLATKSTFNPVTNKWFGFSDNFTIDPGDYLKSKWEAIGLPNGPSTYFELLQGGILIKQKFPEIQIPIGIGYSQDIDSNMATRAILWSFDASTQDENENVVINSPETLEALRFGAELFTKAMDPAILSWNAASNNQALNANQTSYILNSISAYRTAQDNKLPVADDIFFVPALRGPRGTQFASEHVMGVYVIWNFAKSQDLAKEFLVALTDNYGSDGFAAPASSKIAGQKGAVLNSKLYNTPSFFGAAAPASVTNPADRPAAGKAALAEVFANDPFGSKPANKLQGFFETALNWSTNVGHPGPINPAEGEVFDTFLLPEMFAKVATGALTPENSLAQTNAKIKDVFKKWRDKGLVGGGSGDK